MGHHIYTNIDGHDPDIWTAPPESPDVRRIKKNQHWMTHYFYQHLYLPLLYCFVSYQLLILHKIKSVSFIAVCCKVSVGWFFYNPQFNEWLASNYIITLHEIMIAGSIRLNKPSTYMYVRFYGGKFTHVFYRLIIPLYLMPIWKMVGNGCIISTDGMHTAN